MHDCCMGALNQIQTEQNLRLHTLATCSIGMILNVGHHTRLLGDLHSLHIILA